MKIKNTMAALFVGFLPLTSAQDAPAGKAAPKEVAEEIKAEGPLEERAFRIFDLVVRFADVIASIKDEATLFAAETKLDAIGKKLDAEVKELEKLPVAPNEDRKNLAIKMELKEGPLQKKMQGIMTSMAQMDPALAQGANAIRANFGEKMQQLSPRMEKHFAPDEEQGKKDE